MTTQIERQYQKLWQCLSHKPRDDEMSVLIDNTLTEREAGLLRMRFGLTGESPTSVVETASHLETDEDAVRETEAVALRKLWRTLGTS